MGQERAQLESVVVGLDELQTGLADSGELLDMALEEEDEDTIGELVADQERVTRELLAFLGLDWHDACLRFHESDRVVATASHAQVRRPLYRSSVGRFRHYRPWLEPLIDALDWEAWRQSGFAGRVDACLAALGVES